MLSTIIDTKNYRFFPSLIINILLPYVYVLPFLLIVMLGTAVVTSASLNCGSYASSDYHKHLCFSLSQSQSWSLLGAVKKEPGLQSSKYWDKLATVPFSKFHLRINNCTDNATKCHSISVYSKLSMRVIVHKIIMGLQNGARASL